MSVIVYRCLADRQLSGCARRHLLFVRTLSTLIPHLVDIKGDLTPAYAARQCAEYGELGLMGVTFLYASGDWGVAGVLVQVTINSVYSL
ncbi:hypothetical protein BDY19DRAFT_922273 [Irpex rosettiformis]|uniref:Uncharacterized protein n=1 Tax=Irpex rosettiformis TaxID=378272 RepID=A0ACB8UFT6_9APHY|nr:hypothetical protein BDY19DRAFT_922273 [Irpex rosettiformis]